MVVHISITSLGLVCQISTGIDCYRTYSSLHGLRSKPQPVYILISIEMDTLSKPVSNSKQVKGWCSGVHLWCLVT